MVKVFRNAGVTEKAIRAFRADAAKSNDYKELILRYREWMEWAWNKKRA